MLQAGDPVSLPHNAVELPFNYFDETSYQRAFTYQKVIAWRPDFAGREISIVFDAAMADAVVYLNGEEIIAHKDGYTPFEARLTGRLRESDNLITVKIDGSENPEIPPFGGRIDYLTYAGIYRDVWLKITDPVAIANIKIEPRDVLSDTKSVSVRCDLANPQGLAVAGTVTALLRDANGEVLAEAVGETSGESVTLDMTGLKACRSGTSTLRCSIRWTSSSAPITAATGLHPISASAPRSSRSTASGLTAGR